MFLSRLTLDARDRRARRVLADPYEQHRLVLLGFPADLDQGGCRVLFRLEPEVGGTVRTILVQSNLEPDWSAREAQQLAALSGSETKRLRLALSPGCLARFRLRANPTKRDKATAKRVGIVSEAGQLTWLQRKGSAAGFAVDHAQTLVVPEDGVRSRRPGESHERWIVCHGVRFEGVLKVTDPAALNAAVRCGIGSGKAFGFGLLSLAPAR